jgi:hypothetical protein
MNILAEWLRASRLLSDGATRAIHWNALALAVALALVSAIPAKAQSGITDLIVARKVNLQGYATPAALTVDANDYAPAGMANATFLRLSSTAPVNISGIAGGTHGRMLWIINVGTFNLTLLDQSGLSLAGNRFSIGGPTIIPPGAAVSFWYDGTTALRWMGLVQGKSTTSWGGITGNITNQTDLNDAMARLAQASLTTGVADENDTVLLSAPNATTLRIGALQAGVFAALLGPGLPVTTAVKAFAQTDYPLASLGLVADGTYARWIGYNSAGTVVASTTSFVNDETVISLGAIVVKRVGGVTSFIDDGGPRSFATLPQMSGFSELERTYLGYESTVTITPASTNMTLTRSAGIIRGISINWGGFGNKNSLDQAAAAGASFIQVNPALAAGTSLPGAVTVLTATNYWNGAASVPLTNNNNASVKRFLLGIKGGLFVQEGEFQYGTLDLAVANADTAPFTTLLAQDLFIEIGRVAVVKNASDLSNPTQARFFVVGGGSGGSSGGSPSAVTSINGTAGEINANSPVGAVTLSLPSALVFTGKTIAGGTFNAPTLTGAALGTPASGVMTNVSGTALGLTAGNVVTNANLTGDVTSIGNATTLATVTASVGTFGSGSLVPVVTVNAKGLVTAITTQAVTLGANNLTGTTLASNVVNASLNSIIPVGGTLAVTGSFSATGTVTAGEATGGISFFGGIGGTTATKSLLILNGGSANAGGSMVGFRANSLDKGYVGLLSVIDGGPVADMVVRSISGSVRLQAFNSEVATLSNTGMAVTGGISSTGNMVSGGKVQALGSEGFSVTSFIPNARNPIYYFGNAPTYGVSYFQGTSGAGGVDSIGFHFGTATSAGSSLNINATGIAVAGAITASGAITAGSAFASTGAVGVNGASRITMDYDAGSLSGRVLGWGASAGVQGAVRIGTISSDGSLNNLSVGVFSSTGLAVTGGITATGQIKTTTSGGATSLVSEFGGAGNGLVIANTTDTSNAIYQLFLNSVGGGIGSITRVGTNNQIVLNNSSDARLKKNVRDFTAQDSGRLIDALRPRWFDWKSAKDESGKNIIGFIAQEEAAAGAELIRIGAVTPGDPGATEILKTWMRSDSALVPILVAELKSVRARLAKLEGAK